MEAEPHQWRRETSPMDSLIEAIRRDEADALLLGEGAFGAVYSMGPHAVKIYYNTPEAQAEGAYQIETFHAIDPLLAGNSPMPLPRMLDSGEIRTSEGFHPFMVMTRAPGTVASKLPAETLLAPPMLESVGATLRRCQEGLNDYRLRTPSSWGRDRRDDIVDTIARNHPVLARRPFFREFFVATDHYIKLAGTRVVFGDATVDNLLVDAQSNRQTMIDPRPFEDAPAFDPGKMLHSVAWHITAQPDQLIEWALHLASGFYDCGVRRQKKALDPVLVCAAFSAWIDVVLFPSRFPDKQEQNRATAQGLTAAVNEVRRPTFVVPVAYFSAHPA